MVLEGTQVQLRTVLKRLHRFRAELNESPQHRFRCFIRHSSCEVSQGICGSVGWVDLPACLRNGNPHRARGKRSCAADVFGAFNDEWPQPENRSKQRRGEASATSAEHDQVICAASVHVDNAIRSVIPSPSPCFGRNRQNLSSCILADKSCNIG